MADVYTDINKAGKIKSSEGTSALLDFGENTDNLIIYSVNGKVAENFQALKNLEGETFITTFGSQLQPFSITGLYIKRCDGGEASPFEAFYDKNRVSVKKDTVKLTYAGTTIKGFVTSMTLQPYANNEVTSFKYTINIIGEKTGAAT